MIERNRRRGGLAGTAALAILGMLPTQMAVADDAAATNSGTVILDTYSYWREYVVFRAPVFVKTTAEAASPTGGLSSPPPPSQWKDPAFDDSAWRRGRGPSHTDSYGFGGNQSLDMICLRGKFRVDDSAKVERLTISGTYRGGAVVYLNGKEVARGQMGKADVTADSLAEEYSWDAYVQADGKTGLKGGRDAAANKERLELRIRRLQGVEIPKETLRKGVNVVAVEIHRAPINPDSRTLREAWSFAWSTAAFLGLEVRCSPGDAAIPNMERPKGIQMWNADPMTGVLDVDYGDPNEALGPIRLAGTLNGAFSGQAVIGSDQPIRKLQAVAGDLTAVKGGAKIPAGRIRVRYPQATVGAGWTDRFRGGQNCTRFDAMAESAPEEIAGRKVTGAKGAAATSAVVQPIWITVSVPRDAVEGEYTGKLTVSAEGMKPVEVGVELGVAGWVMPDPTNFVSHVGIVESPESVALYYKKPMWSEEHWKLVERSMQYLGEAGTSAVFVPLIAKNHFGKEAMVRWIKKPDGSYEYDFKLFDRYMDLVTKHMGKPQVVCLYAWDLVYGGWNARAPQTNICPWVSVLDPATGEVSERKCPPYYATEAADFWKPVMEACKERLLKRNVPESALTIGIASDSWPTKAETEMFKKAAPWATWVRQGHQDGGAFWGVPIKYLAFVWGAHGLKDPSTKRLYGWKVEQVRTVFPRPGACRLLRNTTLLSNCWTLQEYMTAAGYRGIARVGADFWPVFKGANRHYGGDTIAGMYASWGQTCISESCLDLLYPGPDGALSTLRLESYRQGVQEAEARIFIEKALDDKAQRARMSEDLAKRAQGLLDARARLLVTFQEGDTMSDWYISTGWQKRSAELYAMAAEIAGTVK